MEPTDLLPLLDRLEDNVDDLEEVLQPLLQRPLTDTSRKLPVLDRAKLHVLITYTLESLLFCTFIDDYFFYYCRILTLLQPTCVSMASMRRSTQCSES